MTSDTDAEDTAARAPEWLPMSTAPRDGATVLLVTRNHGVVEGWFSAGYWSEDTPISPREYTGDAWVCADDEFQIEADQTGSDECWWDDGEAIGWLPRSTLPAPPHDGARAAAPPNNSDAG